MGTVDTNKRYLKDQGLLLTKLIVGVLGLLCLFVAGSFINTAQAQSGDAVVQSVKGKAWKRDDLSKKPVTLKSGDELLGGQWVSCPKGCKELVISYCNVDRPVLHTPTWKQILAI